jgi:D-tyrosyl-tRNA(Tyr) deacylase
MRIFPEKSGVSGFDQSVQEITGGLLLISQFTLYASTRKGRRPSFIDAAHRDMAQSIFDKTVQAFQSSGLQIQTGIFGASMNVKIDNSGPFTILLDSRDKDIPRRRQT